MNTFSYNKIPVYATILRKYQRVMHWGLIIEAFRHNIQNLDRFYNIVSDTVGNSALTANPLTKDFASDWALYFR